jgi:hypothetical protein
VRLNRCVKEMVRGAFATAEGCGPLELWMLGCRASKSDGKSRRKGDRFIEFLMGEVFVFINYSVPPMVNCATAGLKRGKKLSGEAPSPRFRSWFKEFCKKFRLSRLLYHSLLSGARDQNADRTGAFQIGNTAVEM